MWGDEVFFPVAQLVLAAPLFIMVIASQHKPMASSRGGSPVIPPEQIASRAWPQHSDAFCSCLIVYDESFTLATEWWIGYECPVVFHAT